MSVKKALSGYKKNDILTLQITDLNNLGAGVGHTEDGVTVFVTGAVTGDLVEAKIIKIASSYLVARLERVVKDSPYRASENACKAPLSCGGCCYRSVKYEYELEIKRAYVKNAFRKVGLPEVEVEETLSNGIISGYRNKGQYPVRQTKDGMRAGFFATGTHRLIPCEDCMLQPPEFADIVRFIIGFAEARGISAYDEESGKGILRHIYLRVGKKTGEIMVCIVINADRFPKEEIFARETVERFPSVKSVMINVNKKNTNVILGDKTYCVGGRDYIIDELCGVKLCISAGSFYQVNRDMAEKLYMLAAERAGLDKQMTVADLYCGTGSIGLSMASCAGLVVGVEIVPEAIECAKRNAEMNGIENARFYCGDASDTEGILAGALRELDGKIPDVVVIDPPRKGSTKELVDYLDRLGIKKVVYVSCDPDTLARDCKWFAECGYEIGNVTPVDLFPGTGHVETVVLLSRRMPKDYLEVNVELDDDFLTKAESKGTYDQIKQYIFEKYQIKVSSLYIAQVKEACGIKERENYNHSKKEDSKQPKVPEDKRKIIMEALQYFKMI